MRARFNLDIKSYDSLSMLVYGMYGCGKTHFMGTALQWALTSAKCPPGGALYLNVANQDGYMSIANMELGTIGEVIEEVADLEEFLKQFETEPPLFILCVDSLLDIARLVMRKVTKADRIPKGGRGNENEWTRIHHEMGKVVRQLKRCSRYLLVSAPAQRHLNPVTNMTWIMPDLPGKQAFDMVGEFDFVGYLRAATDFKGKVKRHLIVKQMPEGDEDQPGILTRQRMAKEITTDIVIPPAVGGWQEFMAVVEKGMV
jgi:hypothetical protein